MIVIIVEMLNIYLLCKTDCSGNRVSVVRVNHETHLEIDFLECNEFILVQNIILIKTLGPRASLTAATRFKSSSTVSNPT